MKLKQKLVIILPILILCLIVVYYITSTRHKTTEIPPETKMEESSTAPATTNETEVVASTKSPESNTTAPTETATLTPEDISIMEGIINNQNTSVFKGNEGKQNIYMAIFRNENELSASYVTSYDDDTETHLTGSIDVNRASFALSNEDGSITFQGLIKPGTQKGDLLVVDYKNKKDNIEENFDLSLSHSFASSPQERYPFAEASTEDVETFAKNIKLYITNDKKKELAEIIQYPINVTIRDAKKTINSSDEFIQLYDDIITADFKDKISKSYTRYLFSNDNGIMMGNGEIWIHSLDDIGLRIFAINN